MGERFAFLLPIMMFTFSVAFLTAWRWGPRSCLWWGLGFLCGSTAFCLPLLDRWLPATYLTMIADIVFATSFLLYGQALLERIDAPTHLRPRLAIWAGSLAFCAAALFVFDNVRMELIASDYGCALLLCFPIVEMRKRLARPIDWAMITITILVFSETTIRGSTVVFTMPDDSQAFMASDYAFYMQAAAATFGMIFALTGLAAAAIDLLARYRIEALTDPLSGLLNRRGFEDAASQLKAGTVSSGSVVSCDIDHFKRVNDQFGHAVGDMVIVALADAIRAHMPQRAIAARFGGEEFVVYLPYSHAADATRFAHAVRRSFAEHDWASDGITMALTTSLGLSSVQASDFSLHDAIARADAALYDAKKAGRDRVSVKLAVVPGNGPPAGADLARQIGEPKAG